MQIRTVEIVKIDGFEYLRQGPCDWYIWNLNENAYEGMDFHDTVLIESEYEKQLKEEFLNDKYA